MLWICHFIRQVCYSSGPSIISANTINILYLGMLTETEKGKEVLEKGILIGFPLEVTTSTKSSGPRRFSNPPRDIDEKLYKITL